MSKRPFEEYDGFDEHIAKKQRPEITQDSNAQYPVMSYYDPSSLYPNTMISMDFNRDLFHVYTVDGYTVLIPKNKQKSISSITFKNNT
ncbi:hypothetical protein QKU48_gp1009 [Fadolivirus algeromassiliense]|jgi:hypothetical protein|uniref:Uncharacterized protein n=1 Tax=Fadolivirus FV1/VV64 TaxID=3070911 RepID=A0A7D3QUU7_9VIRU|nr:hypothetical protein QKU48_gp1009 [Fadolivirus algeromassiliense]QKF94467.1 hypothetical protein Fadolivirus_1_1009 [Fadolivirus FV1/VV64]